MMTNKFGMGRSSRRTFRREGWKSVVAMLLVCLSAFRYVLADPDPTTSSTGDDGTAFVTENADPEFGNTGEVGQQVLSLPSLDQVQCASYFCYDRTTKQVLISKSEDKKIYPASMTKILTLALAMEYLDPHEKVTVSQSAMSATTPNSTMMGLETGEEIEVNELYYGLMLPSGNDAANVLAEEIAKHYASSKGALPTTTPKPVQAADGTTEMKTEDPNTFSLIGQFAYIANMKIQSLGLTHSHFMNPNGLQNDNHYTTAQELAMMFDYALQFEDFRTVIRTPTHAFKADNKHQFDGWKIVRNTNFLLQDPWLLGENTHCVEIFGGKTGTTKTAGTGMTLLSINQNGHEVITAVCGIPYSMSDHQTVYVATVVNAAHDACWNNDPNVKVSGNVMDYRSYNAPRGQEPTGDKTVIHIGTPTPIPTEAPEPTQTQAPVVTQAPEQVEEKKSMFEEHPVLVIVLIVLGVIVITLIIFTFLSAYRIRRRRKKMGIRKIL